MALIIINGLILFLTNDNGSGEIVIIKLDTVDLCLHLFYRKIKNI